MKRIKNILASTLLVSSLASVTPVLADNYDDQLQEAVQQAEENEQAAASLDNIMKQLTNEVTNTQAALDNLAGEIQKNEQLLEDAIIELGIAHEEMKTLQDEIAVLEENIENRSEQLEKQARKIQVNGTSTSTIDFILSAESITDIIARIDIVSKVVGTSSKMLEDQIEDKKAVIEKTEETERKIVQQNAISEKLEKTAIELESQKISQEALVAQLEIEQSTVGSERDALIAQRNEALQRLDQIESEREQVRLAIEQAETERLTVANNTESVNESQQNVSRPSSSDSASIPGETSSSQPNTSSNSNSGDSQSRPNPAPAPTPEATPNPAPETAPAPESKPKPNPTPTPPPKPTPEPSGDVLTIARQYLGTPYLYGGTTPNAFDCSGYTRYVFAQAGKTIPRTSGAQYAGSTKVSNPQPGDLVFFGESSITHVGIYLGGGRFIGSQSHGGTTGVSYATLNSGYWSNKVIGYGRY